MMVRSYALVPTLAACLAIQHTSLPTRSTPAVDRLLAAVEAAYQAKDARRFVDLFTNDFTQVDVNRRVEIRGSEAWLRQTETVNAAHREMSRRHRGRAVHGAHVFAEIEWTGTIRGAELGAGAPDKSYRFGGFGVLELAGEKIRKQVLFIDYATYRDQLGEPNEVRVQRELLPKASQGLPPPPGRLIDVGGRRLHLHCLGARAPTLVVDQGAGGWSGQWMHLHRRLAANSRTCLYDRAGLGWSDPAPGPATAGRAADDLARLLAAAGERGPYVLVGHSYGGYVARVLAKSLENVRGIVLVESGHEDQWTRLPPPLPEITKEAITGLRELAAAIRSRTPVPVVPVDSGYSDPDQIQLLEAVARTPGPYEELANVIASMDSSTAAVRRAGRFDSLPLVVITARRSFDAFRHLPISVEASNAVWMTLQAELANLSNCVLRVWSDTGDHNIQVSDPTAVLTGVRAMVEALQGPGRSGCPLTGRAPPAEGR